MSKSPRLDAQRVAAAQRRAEVVRLRTHDGLSYPAIAARLGTAISTAHGDFERALAEDFIPIQERVAAKRTAHMKLDEAERRLLEVLNRTHYATTQGGRLVLDQAGQPLIDDGPVIAAVNSWVRLMAERNKIDGVYVPTQIIDVTPEAVAAAVDGRCRELGIDPERARELARTRFALAVHSEPAS